jgi:hypothetical protein
LSEYGVLEKNMPLLSLRMPKSFIKSNYFTNLNKNKNRLVSFYDLHQTLRHFLFLQDMNHTTQLNNLKFNVNDKKTPHLRGISLFEKIPVNRSCSEALIPDNFCNCITTTLVDEKDFKKRYKITFDYIFDFILERINEMTELNHRNICIPYHKGVIHSVFKFNITKNSRYKFTLIVQPGDAWFQASIQITKEPDLVIRDYGRLIRMSIYREQAHCVDNAFIKPYCYCDPKLNITSKIL